MKFSYRIDYDSVSCYWTDGPMKEDVQKVLNRFESYTRILARDDRKEATGYEWGGTLYVGPKYLNANRSLSNERKISIKNHVPYW
ncbi:hypothetical protein IDH45_06045 [Paenibacillus sp. IB182363]|uniref:Large polyvalent protein associated domain-containing protein n=1 Tax=Paenibacillus oceani TaxID=2772510 RepID=A0A927C8P8_9BACL|nr:hypothetical protein [Paenibacillus oceani]